MDDDEHKQKIAKDRRAVGTWLDAVERRVGRGSRDEILQRVMRGPPSLAKLPPSKFVVVTEAAQRALDNAALAERITRDVERRTRDRFTELNERIDAVADIVEAAITRDQAEREDKPARRTEKSIDEPDEPDESEREKAEIRARFRATGEGLVVDGGFVLPWIVLIQGYGLEPPKAHAREVVQVEEPERKTLVFEMSGVRGVATPLDDGLKVSTADHEFVVPWSVIREGDTLALYTFNVKTWTWNHPADGAAMYSHPINGHGGVVGSVYANRVWVK